MKALVLYNFGQGQTTINNFSYMIFSFLQYFCFDKKAIHMSLKNMSPDFSITRKWRKHNKSKIHLFLKSYLKKKITTREF